MMILSRRDQSMRALRALRTLSRLHPYRFVSTSTLGSPVPLSRSESLVKEMSPIANFLAIVTTIGAIGAFFLSRLEKLEERVAGLLKEVDAKVAGVTTAVDAKVAGVVKEVDAKVAGVVKEVDAKVAGVKEAADKTVRQLMHRPLARPPTHLRSLTPFRLLHPVPFPGSTSTASEMFWHARCGFWSSRAIAGFH